MSGYRKWSNGLMEQWRNTMVTTTVKNTWGALFMSDDNAGIEYRTPFSVPPLCIMTVKAEGSDSGFLIQHATGDEKKTPNFRIVRGQVLNTNGKFNINIWAMGTWK